jgi:hypothetical protein
VVTSGRTLDPSRLTPTPLGDEPLRRWSPSTGRARESAQEVASQTPFGVFVPIDLEAAIKGLSEAAICGNAQAARELRAWLAEHPTTLERAEYAVKQPKDMTAAELEHARSWLLQRIAEDRQSEEDAVVDAAPSETVRLLAPSSARRGSSAC